MPTTFEALVDALKKAEATKILKAPSAVDPLQHTAHATASGGRSPSPTKVSPGKCSVCGAHFSPKKPQHTRCEACQEAYVKQRKKEQKKGKTKKDKPKDKGSDRKAHFTELEDELGSQPDDEESHDQHEGTSFSCICSTRVTQSDGMIYLDNCSNLNVIRDSQLALNVRRERLPRVSQAAFLEP